MGQDTGVGTNVGGSVGGVNCGVGCVGGTWWDMYRWNGEWVGEVRAVGGREALRVGWNRYFGCPSGVLEPRDDGTLRVVERAAVDEGALVLAALELGVAMEVQGAGETVVVCGQTDRAIVVR